MAGKPTRQPPQQPAPQRTEASASRQVVAQITAESASWSSPIPPPSVMAQYNEVIPNGADRLLQMVESQHANRIFLERVTITGDARRSYVGLLAATVVALGAMAVASIAILSGQGLVGLAIVIGEITGIAWTFLRATQSRREEREDRLKAMTNPAQPPRRNK